MIQTKRKRLLAAALISAVAGGAQAASPTVSLVGDTSNLTPGTTFSLSIIGTDFPAFTGGGLSFSVDDASILQIDSATPAASWDPEFSGDAEVSADKKTAIDLNFGSFTGAGPGTVTIGTISFTALKAGTATVTLSDDFVTNGGFVDELGPLVVAFNSATVTIKAPTAVPVPAALWLLGSGLMGLVGWSRRRAA